jgi:hypothetical protein
MQAASPIQAACVVVMPRGVSSMSRFTLDIDRAAARLARAVLCELAVYAPHHQHWPLRLVIRALRGA